MRQVQCRICPELYSKIDRISKSLHINFADASRIYMLSKDIRIVFKSEDQTVERMIR